MFHPIQELSLPLPHELNIDKHDPPPQDLALASSPHPEKAHRSAAIAVSVSSWRPPPQTLSPLNCCLEECTC